MISGEAEKLVKGIFIDCDGLESNHIRVECNWCIGKTFAVYNGLDLKLPETNWLAEIIEHLVAEHADRLSS